LSWLKRIFAGNNDNLAHLSQNNTPGEKARRLAAISDEEQQAYNWLFEGYSEAWTTETLGLEKQDAEELYNIIYRKLGITGAKEIIRYYAPREVHFTGLPGTDQLDGN
jgi:hypothetical protein